VFDGHGRIRVGDREWSVQRGDLVAVPSWARLTLTASSELNLFRFSDTPIFERLHAARVWMEGNPE
jgi:gentisate 1,2-dioxygenase